MGMYGTLRRASAADVERLRAAPSLVESFVFGEPPPPPPQKSGGLFGFLRKLSPITVTTPPAQPAPTAATDEEILEDAWRDASSEEVLHLDKAWHGLHYLLTGESDGGDEPACFLMSGGEEFDDEGDPFVQLLSPEKVRAFAAFLDVLDRETLQRRFDPARMVALDIYPSPIWEREEDYPPVRYLLDAYDDLRGFMSAAAKAGDSVVVCIG